MKTSILLLSVVLSACTPRQHITGHIDGLNDDTLIVHSCAIADLPAAGSDPTRSIPRDTLVVRNGRLAFDRPVDQPTIFTIRPAQTVMRIPGGHRWFSSVSDIVFFLDAGERIEIRACVDSIYTDYSLAGSRLNKTWSRYRAGQFELQKELTRLMLRLDQAEAAEAVSIQTTLRSLQQRVFGSATRYIREHPSEPLSGYLLASVPADSAAVCIDRLDNAVRHSVFSPLIAHAARQIEAHEIRRQACERIEPGNAAPDFTLEAADGSDFALSSLRGKYVVLDFWGSWCGWCIRGFPRMKELHDRYRNKLEIVGIACNDTRQNWLAAVEKYRLPWINVFCPRDAPPAENVATVYGVDRFPTKLIVGPDGRIVAVYSGEGPDFYRKLHDLLQ